MNKRPYAITAIAILWYLLTACSPGLAFEESSLSKGLKAFAAKHFKTAYHHLLDAFEQTPDNLELNFYLGRAAFESGEYEMAVMAYERILIASPSEPRIKLEIARAFHRLGSNRLAKQYCNEVLDTNPPDTVKANILAFLKKIDASEQTYFIETAINLGVEWNNNIWASPTDKKFNTSFGEVILSGDSSKKKSGIIVSSMLEQIHTFRPLHSKFSWITKGTLYQGLNNESGDLDIFHMGAQTGPGYNLEKDQFKLLFSLGELEIGGDAYSDTQGLTVLWDHAFNPGFIFGTTMAFKNHNYPANSSKDSSEQSLSLETGFSVYETWIRFGGRTSRESAYDDQYSNNRYSAFFSASRQIGKDITGTINYEYQYAGFKAPATLFDRNRMDHTNFAGLNFSKELFKSRPNKNYRIYLGLNYQHIWTYSNIPLYEYRKDQVQVMLSCKF